MQLADDQLTVSIDYGEHVVEVMCDSTCQSSNGLHLLRLSKLCFKRFSFSDVYIDSPHTSRLAFVVRDNRGMRFDPHPSSVLADPTKFRLTTLTAGELFGRFSGDAFLIIWIDDGEPEVWCRKPFRYSIAEERFNVFTDKINALIGLVRFAPCLPNNHRDALYDALQLLFLFGHLDTQPGGLRF